MKNWKIANTSLIAIAAFFSLETMAQETPRDKTDTIKVKKEQVVEEQVIIEERVSEPEVFIVVEDMPEFPGGMDSMAKFISYNIVYPRSAMDNKIQGRVVVQFVVDEEGRITDVKVISGPLGWGLDEAAVDVVKKMPRWEPGRQRGKPVKVRFVVPIRFQLSTNPQEEKN